MVTEIKCDGGEFASTKPIKHAFNANVNIFLNVYHFILNESQCGKWIDGAQKMVGDRPSEVPCWRQQVLRAVTSAKSSDE
jgi:hypothetical protein